MSSRLDRFKEARLLGCLNDTGVTSTNYKDYICPHKVYLVFEEQSAPYGNLLREVFLSKETAEKYCKENENSGMYRSILLIEEKMISG